MEDLLRQVMAVLRSMWKHHWLGLAVAWLIAMLGAGIVWRVPDKYEASARIYVDTQSILKPLMSGLAIQPNIDQQVVMLSRTLISRPNIEKLVRMADLDLATQSKGDTDKLIEHLTETLQIRSTARDNLYTLSFRDPQPEKAKRVVQSLVSIFVESSLGDSRKDSDDAKKFIVEQIKSYEEKLAEAENRLKEFKLKNIDAQLEDGKGGMVGRFSELTSQLSQARLELREAENAREALRKQILGDSSASQDPLSVPMPDIDGRIETQKRLLDTLLQRYTEQHPDVLGARRAIRELEEQKRREVLELRKAAAANPNAVLSSASGASQDIRRSLATVEAQVASLRARVGEYEARFARTKELMKSAPQLEAEYAQLNRDYQVHKKNYEDLVARRESATISDAMGSVAGLADFRLIDPPRVSSTPVAPNRLLLLPLVLLVSLAGGLGACYIASQIRPVFMDARALREATGLPLLGSVSLAAGHEKRIRESSGFKRFMLGISALIGAFAAAMAFLIIRGGVA